MVNVERLEILDLVAAEVAQGIEAGILVEIVQGGVVEHRGDHLVDGLFGFDDRQAVMN